MPRIAASALLPCLLLALAGASFAQEPNAPEPAPAPAPAPDATAPSADHWEFSLAPYLWTIRLRGKAEAHGLSTDIDVNFSDILDALDVGALAAFEARRGPLSFTTNVIYLKVHTDVSHPVGERIPILPGGSLLADARNQTVLVEERANWQVLSLPLFDETGKRRVAFDVGPGFRYWWLDNDIDVTLRPGLPIGPFKAHVHETTGWVDLVVGARLRSQLTDKLQFIGSADYGGFGFGTSSNYTWSLTGYLTYRMFENWDLAAGWRTLMIQRGFGPLYVEGPLVGLVYRF